LHFVGDADRARSAHVAVNPGEISGGKIICPPTLGKCFRNVRGDAKAFGPRALQNFADMASIFCAGLYVPATIRTVVIIRERRNMYPRLLAAAARAVEFVGLMSISVLVWP